MKQVWISKAGKPEVLTVQEAPDPLPSGGEVRIRVEAIGVNFADILGRMGMYPDAPSLPYVPGYEVSGVVDALGQGVPNLSEGDHVLAVTRFGGYSDVVCVPYGQVFKRSGWMGAEDAAGLPVAYLTAYMMLMVMGSLRASDKVLIHGAGGGVGLAALDICRIAGAQTFGTASLSKHEFLVARGLDYPIDYHNQDYEIAVQTITDGQGVQLVLDPLGGKHWMKNYRLLMPTGRLIHFGISAMAPQKRRSLWAMVRAMVTLPFYSPLKLMSDNKAVMGVNLAHMWEHTDFFQAWMAQLLAWYDEALFRPHVDKTFPLEEASKAHHYIQDRKNTGKVLLIP